MKTIFGRLVGLKNGFLKASLIKKVIVVAFILGISWFFVPRLLGTNKEQPQYQTAQAEKGTLITSVSASGTVSRGSSASMITQATGIVKEVYVSDGDIVTAGQKIAEITLDTVSKQKQAAAWANYLSAKNNLESAKTTIYTLQSAMFEANQKFINDAVARDLPADDPTYIQQNADWLAAEAKYKNQQSIISQAQASVSSRWLSYAQLSSTITAPIAGKVSGLILSRGSVLGSSKSSNSTTTNTASQSVGTIIAESSSLQASVNITEIDAVKVRPGQKATLTLDAFPDKTFTGRVTTVNTSGSVSSGVTTYPTTITFDSALDNMYPNMAVNSIIITNIKDNVILVPSGAIQAVNNQSIVRVMKNGQVTSVPVKVGDANDTQTEIASGINEGDTVITGSTTTKSNSPSQGTTSPFGGSFGGRGEKEGKIFIKRR